MSRVIIRDATAADWPAIWSFMSRIVAAGDTFTWNRDTTGEQARAMWLRSLPGATLVAIDGDGAVLGSAELHPNQGGAGSHVANAGFMVAPEAGGRGVGRALGEAVLDRATANGFRAMVFNAVVSTNANAVHLWQSLGFRILATVPEGFRHPEHGYVGLHIMYRPLQ
jgi:L-amino acid N-acyltransferase YncA